MSMRDLLGTRRWFRWGRLAVCGGVVCVGLAWAGHRIFVPKESTAATVALQVPADPPEITGALPMIELADSERIAQSFGLFDPRPMLPQQETLDAASRMMALSSPTATPPSGAAPARPTQRANAVFSETQIAGIKSRLKLTPAQQRHWGPVEAALRGLTWQGKKRGPRGEEMVVVDVAKVERLKAAVMPLIEVLNEAQKREVRLLAHVVGLGRLASQF